MTSAPGAAAARHRHGGLWLRGHRLFFLAAALLAAAFVPAWMLIYAGALPAPQGLPVPVWHGHEMLFGYVLAVLSGFLLLADSGPRVAALLALWAAGRITGVVPLPEAAAAAVQLAYLPALALLRRPPFWRRPKWPTAGFPALFLALLAAEALALGLGPGSPQLGLLVAADLFTLMALVIGGRLVAGYTRAAGLPVDRPHRPVLEALSVAGMLAVVAGEAVGASAVTGAAALAVALMQAVRLAGWSSWQARGEPLLWVLHLGFAWLVAGLALRGVAAATDLLPATAALHAVAVGGFGSLTLGMMCRLTRSHARAPLAVGRLGAVAFLAVSAAALARVLGPAVGPTWELPALVLAAAFWTAAFLLFLIGHAALLSGVRRAG